MILPDGSFVDGRRRRSVKHSPLAECLADAFLTHDYESVHVLCYTLIRISGRNQHTQACIDDIQSKTCREGAD